MPHDWEWFQTLWQGRIQMSNRPIAVDYDRTHSRSIADDDASCGEPNAGIDDAVDDNLSIV
ncbi:hypothetical protein ZHAS_00004581 [Anopheles sinensis]|uniref:Uncharacterized protein n=1 Tax=Anopheles sinensis TaxID=74873 RepID=A0A084VHK2_ANOSI|nr:hypothetical protein ZHAS_00004581 [Anopheles sinensis]